MKILLVGAGGVGSAFCAIAARRDFFESVVVADYAVESAERAVAEVGDARFTAAQVDASDAGSVERLARESEATHVMNAVDPRFVMPIFEGALAAGADYLDMAMSLSKPHPTRPYALTGVKLGDEQFAAADDWESAGRLALVGIGVEPGLSDVFARYAADRLFSSIAELATRPAPNRPRAGPTSRRRSRSGRPSKSASTRRSSGKTVTGTRPSRSASRRCSTSPRASGRSSA